MALGARSLKPGHTRFFVGYKKHSLRLWLHSHPTSVQLMPIVSWITPADVPTAERLEQVFARAREHSPSILFIDELDGLLPRGDNGYYMGQHQIQLVEQALMLMSQLDPGNQVFLIGTTNHIDNIDPRVLRGGRFTEKIEIGIPDDGGYLRLIDRYLGPIPLAAGLATHDIVGRLMGISPADLQALVSTAKRMAMNRMKDGEETLPPLIWDDFEGALKRNQICL